VATGGEGASTTLQYLGNGQWLTPGSLGDSFTYMERHSLSRIEVLVVIGMISVAGVLLVSAFGRTTQGPREVACLSNTRRLVDAWQMYARDNHEVLLWAYGSHSNMAPYVWSGPAGYPWDIAPETPSNPGNWDRTNTIARSRLWSYCGKSAEPWHCPADSSTGLTPSGVRVPRPRSYSMNSWVGGDGDAAPLYQVWSTDQPWVVYRKLGDLVRPGPASTWVLMDEHADSINDGSLVVQMRGYTGTPNDREQIVDFPASSHGHGAGVGFADGHSEIHKWLDARVFKPSVIMPSALPNSPDVFWLQDHSTRLRSSGVSTTNP